MKDSETIVSLHARRDLVPVVARWIFDTFWPDDCAPFPELLAHFERSAAHDVLIPKTFVLLDGNQPVGTASLEPEDLDIRPRLTPWLASVFVLPEARGQGRAVALVKAVEDAARAGAWDALWLYTSTAERLYAQLGWQTAERFERKGKWTVVMRQDLGRSATSTRAT